MHVSLHIINSGHSFWQLKFFLAASTLYERMRDKMESLVILPFSLGCVSHSSIALGGSNQPKKTKSESNSAAPKGRQESEKSSSVVVNMKSSWGFLAIPKPNISNGLHRLVNSFKSFSSQLFVYKEEVEEMEMEMEMKMEIGFPTDVKHVTHIGWDGTTTAISTTKPGKDSNWENHIAPIELQSFPNSVTLRQFELAMAAQADAPMCLPNSKFA